MLEVKQHHQDSGHITQQGQTFLVPCSATSGASQGSRGQLHCTEITHTAPWEGLSCCIPLGQLVLSPSLSESESELLSLKEMMKNLCSQLSCYNKNSTYEPNFLLFCVCLGNLEQNNTAQHAKISSEAIWLWKSSEAQKETMTALCYQSEHRQN